MGGSNSSSSTATRTYNRDGRVAVDGGSIGISSEGNVALNIVPDEAFNLGEHAVTEATGVASDALLIGADLAYDAQEFAADISDTLTGLVETTQQGASDTIRDVSGIFATALATTQANQKSEAGQIGEQIVRIGLPAAAIAFAVSQIWRN